MNELEIKFNMVKSNGKDFTDDEIDDFNNEFIDLVEKHGYLVAGSIGPYDEDEDDCSDIDIDEFDSYPIDDEDEIGKEWEPTVSDNFTIGPNGAYELDDDDIEYVNRKSKEIEKIKKKHKRNNKPSKDDNLFIG